MPFIPTVDRERVLGLVGTSPMESSGDLAALGIEIVPPAKQFAASMRRQMIAEARAMLSYVSGERMPPTPAIARLVRAFDRQDAQPLGLPRPVIKCPGLLRIFEPLRDGGAGHRLGGRLHMAVMVAESMRWPRKCRPNVSSILGLALLEVIALPLRLLLQRYYA